MSNHNSKQPKSTSSEHSPQLLAERYGELKKIRELVREAELQLLSGNGATKSQQ